MPGAWAVRGSMERVGVALCLLLAIRRISIGHDVGRRLGLTALGVPCFWLRLLPVLPDQCWMEHPAAPQRTHPLGSLNAVQVTVFAPDNDAFARALVALNTTAAAFLAPSNAGLVTSILQYHIVDFKALSTDLKMGDTAANTLSEWCFHACTHDCMHAKPALPFAWHARMLGCTPCMTIYGCMRAWCRSEKQDGWDAMLSSCTRAAPWHGMPCHDVHSAHHGAT